MEQGCSGGLTAETPIVDRAGDSATSPGVLVSATDRDGAGRFAVGNRGGPGNPHAAQCARLRAAMMKALGPAAMGRIVKSLIKRAERGDMAAIKMLFDYSIGKPSTTEGTPSPTPVQVMIVAPVDVGNRPV